MEIVGVGEEKSAKKLNVGEETCGAASWAWPIKPRAGLERIPTSFQPLSVLGGTPEDARSGPGRIRCEGLPWTG